MRSLVHGEDFATSDADEDLEWLKDKWYESCETKTQILENDAREGKALRLNRKSSEVVVS